MPTYDYRCSACGHAFEKFQSMSSDPLKDCPSCGEATAKRLIGTGAAVIFKGGGFYETDYRGDSYKKDADKESGKSEPKSDTKSDGGDGKTSDSKAKPDTTPAKTETPASPSKSETSKPAATESK